MKARKLICNVHGTCIHVRPVSIFHIFGFWHCFPGFCKTVIIQDQAHSTGSASHFVSFKLSKRKTTGETTALSSRPFSALAKWHSRVTSQLASSLGSFPYTALTPRTWQCIAPPPLGVCVQSDLHHHAQPTWGAALSCFSTPSHLPTAYLPV